MNSKSYYEVLGVSATANPEEIRSAYLLRTRMYHPDRFPSQSKEWHLANDMLKELNQAYAALRESRQRSAPNYSQASAQKTRESRSTPSGKSADQNADEKAEKVNAAFSRYSDLHKRSRKRNFAATFFRGVGVLLLISALIFLLVRLNNPKFTIPYLTRSISTESISKPLGISLSSIIPKAKFSATAVPLPANGSITRFTSDKGVAPLHIIAPQGDHYLIRLYNQATGHLDVSLFVKNGQTADVLIPLGNYTMKYVMGTVWYGDKYLFGPNSLYNKVDDPLMFYRDTEGYKGPTVTLCKLPNGTQGTSRISPESF
ncbi:MAG: DnaJ domain-containing protein [Chthoniobacterales bacterium]